jgi:hypothetical protein
MNDPKTPATASGRGPIQTVGRAIAHRWPALVVATVAAAMPLSVALANGATVFTALLGDDAAVTAIAKQGTALSAEGGFFGVEATSSGTAVLATATNRGTAVDAIAGTVNGLPLINHDRVGLASRAELTGVAAVGGDTGVHADGAQYAVKATTVSGTGVSATTSSGTGVEATSTTGTALAAKTTSGTAITADSLHGNAVSAHGDTAAGTFGAGVQASGDVAVVARGTTVGIDATANGTAVSGYADKVGGEFAGKEAPIRMIKASTPGAPTSGVHHAGELYVDSAGLLFYCTADGTPGTWHKVRLD